MAREELIEALRNATGPSYELDAAIEVAIDPETCWTADCPRYTSSLDAALTVMKDEEEALELLYSAIACREHDAVGKFGTIKTFLVYALARSPSPPPDVKE